MSRRREKALTGRGSHSLLSIHAKTEKKFIANQQQLQYRGFDGMTQKYNGTVIRICQTNDKVDKGLTVANGPGGHPERFRDSAKTRVAGQIFIQNYYLFKTVIDIVRNEPGTSVLCNLDKHHDLTLPSRTRGKVFSNDRGNIRKPVVFLAKKRNRCISSKSLVIKLSYKIDDKTM